MPFQIFRGILPFAKRLGVGWTQNPRAEPPGALAVLVDVRDPHHYGADEPIRVRDSIAT